MAHLGQGSPLGFRTVDEVRAELAPARPLGRRAHRVRSLPSTRATPTAAKAPFAPLAPGSSSSTTARSRTATSTSRPRPVRRSPSSPARCTTPTGRPSPSPATAARSRCPPRSPTTSSTAWSGCRPNSVGNGVLADLASPGRLSRSAERKGCTDERDPRCLRQRRLVDRRHQDPAGLPGARAPDAVQHLVGAPGRGPDAAPDRPQRARPVRPAAVAGRRREARLQGGPDPEGRRQGGLRARAGHLRGAGVRRPSA